MNTYTKVRFNNYHGYDTQRNRALKVGLKENVEYEVDRVIIYNHSTDVYLKEFPGIPFNSVMFDNV